MPGKLVILGLEAPSSPTDGVAKTVRRTENPSKMGVSGRLKMAEVELSVCSILPTADLPDFWITGASGFYPPAHPREKKIAINPIGGTSITPFSSTTIRHSMGGEFRLDFAAGAERA